MFLDFTDRPAVTWSGTASATVVTGVVPCCLPEGTPVTLTDMTPATEAPVTVDSAFPYPVVLTVRLPCFIP